jgi:large subunit ribosomal protein L25
MAKRLDLKVDKRTILGKKVKKLRREGLIPANVYGKDMKSSSVQLPLKDFQSVFKEVRETGLVDLKLNGDALPVLIHNVQFDPKSHTPVHADFLKVNLKEKITARIPVIAVGESKAVLDKVGLLEQPVSEIEVEALPTDLPEKIEVKVEHLANVDEQILVSDLKVDSGVTVLNEGSQVVFKIGELVTKEMEAQAAADEAAASAAATEGTEAAEGEKAPEAAPEGEAPTEEPAADGAPAKTEAAEPKKE